MKKAGVYLGIKAGIIIGVLYILMLWLKFEYFAFTPFAFYLASFISYFLILAGLVIVAIRKRNQNGGYAEIRTLFQPLFIAILILELLYVLFTYFYLNKINPDFFQEFEKATQLFVTHNKMSVEKINSQMEIIHNQAIVSKDFWKVISGLLPRWIVIDSIFALMIAFSLRKKVPESYSNLN